MIAVKKYCPRSEKGSSPFQSSSSNGEMFWRDDFTCSYCGSLHPKELFRLIKDGAEVTPTDKDYKIYVTHPKINFGKFYFQHLSNADQTRFIDLINAKKIKFRHPGHFYVKPYFIEYRTLQ